MANRFADLPKLRVRVLMMQRDEGALLLAWFGHYARRFGWAALWVLDNGSTDPYTCAVLERAERLGATILRHYAKPADFQAKGLHFANIIRAWDAKGQGAGHYDLALPCDCDEFLCVVGDRDIDTTPAGLHAVLQGLRGERRALRIGLSLFNVPEAPGWFAVDPHFCKGAIPAGGVDVIDNGQHQPNSTLAPGFAMTRLAYLHWHNRSFADMQARARQKIGYGLIDPSKRADLVRYAHMPQAPGQHLVEVLLNDAQWYRARYEAWLRVRVPGAASPTGMIADPQPFMLADRRGTFDWSPETYLARKPACQGYPHGPLHYFLCDGWRQEAEQGASS